MSECWNHINNFWKEDYYKTCLSEWRKIIEFIDTTGNGYKCSSCGTYWKDKNFIHDTICPKCDTYCQPFLSNPLNFNKVVLYIDPMYWKYIFPIYENFHELDDPHDIFKEDLSEFFACIIGFKQFSEYGTSIEFYTNNGEEHSKFFIVNETHESFPTEKFFISSFSENKQGLEEKIYSNRTEFFINGHYYGNKHNDKIDDIIKQINQLFIEEKISQTFYDFIKSDDTLLILPIDEFSSAYLNVVSCNICHTLDDVETCDFCENRYCEKCCPDEISFRDCSVCPAKWCYFDGKYADYYCSENTRRGGTCEYCGH